MTSLDLINLVLSDVPENSHRNRETAKLIEINYLGPVVMAPSDFNESLFRRYEIAIVMHRRKRHRNLRSKGLHYLISGKCESLFSNSAITLIILSYLVFWIALSPSIHVSTRRPQIEGEKRELLLTVKTEKLKEYPFAEFEANGLPSFSLKVG